MIRLFFISLPFLVTGCAFPQQVQRFGVEYNSALETMSNEQTLLNIVRAKNGMPAHFTSVNRFTGNMNMKAAASLNAALRGEGIVDTAQTLASLVRTGAAPNNIDVETNSQTDTLAITEGVDAYTPQISGEIASGTTFDVAVFDGQKFFQGYTAALPYSLVDNFLQQGFDDELIFYLMVSRIEYTLTEATPGFSEKAGAIIASFENAPRDIKKFSHFRGFSRCYSLRTADVSGTPVSIAPMSRFTRDALGSPVPLDLKHVLQIDGEKFGLARPDDPDDPSGLDKDPARDAKVHLQRLAKSQRLPGLARRPDGTCDGKAGAVPADLLFSAPGTANVALLNSTTGKYEGVLAKVQPRIVFRSPEGMIRYLGEYLRAWDKIEDRPSLRLSDGAPLFELTDGRVRGALVSAELLGKRYSVLNASGSVRNMDVINLVQQVVNLQKESADRPLTLPVRAVQ